jgi:hypothetical protein
VVLVIRWQNNDLGCSGRTIEKGGDIGCALAADSCEGINGVKDREQPFSLSRLAASSGALQRRGYSPFGELLFGSLSRGSRSSLVHVLAFVIDRRLVAPGVITLFESLHVALQLIRFGAFFCHAY